MRFFINILKGICIGVSAFIPGFSGGTIACILECYDELIDAISGIRKHFLKSILTLIPFVIGIGISALSIFPITWGLENYPLITVCLFAGLLIGSIPSFSKNLVGKVNKTNVFSAIICGALVLGIMIINFFVGGGNYVDISHGQWWVYLILLLLGLVGAAALVIPGISGSMILMILGFYQPIMDVIKGFLQSFIGLIGLNINLLGENSPVNEVVGANFILPSFFMVFCFGIGIIVGFYVISILMKYLLTKHRDATYYAIFAFILVSLVGIFANEKYYASLEPLIIVLSIVSLLIGAISSYLLTRIADKKTNVEE